MVPHRFIKDDERLFLGMNGWTIYQHQPQTHHGTSGVGVFSSVGGMYVHVHEHKERN